MEYDFNKTVGKRLYEARKAKGYSRAKVGELVGLHETTVKRYEDGDIKSLDIERLKAFARVLGTPAAELIGWISENDDDLELMLSISQDKASGRISAKEEMYRTFGKESSANDLRMLDDRLAVLYYRALDRRSAIALNAVLADVEDLAPSDMENIMLLIGAYLHADQPIRDIVDTALRPYVDKEVESWVR